MLYRVKIRHLRRGSRGYVGLQAYCKKSKIWWL